MSFRENLKAELEYQDIKTKELAEKSGVNKRTIDHYLMSNPQEPSVTNALKIAQALNVSVEYLVTGKEILKGIPLTKDTTTFINQYTSLSSEQKEVIKKTTELFFKQNSDVKSQKT